MSKYMPSDGCAYNPLTRHRNFPCPCGSGKKAKRCHGRSSSLPKEDVEKIKRYLTGLAEYGFIKKRERETVA